MSILGGEIFTQARFEQLNTIVKYGRFNQVPYDKRTCISGIPDAEDIAHTLFEANCVKKIEIKILDHILNKWPIEIQMLTQYISCASRTQMLYITWPFM